MGIFTNYKKKIEEEQQSWENDLQSYNILEGFRRMSEAKENGIEMVEIKADMSKHYLCYLDREG